MDKRLLDILACPLCKSALRLDQSNNELICKVDALAYPIEDAMPVMIEKRARQLTQKEVKKWASE